MKKNRKIKLTSLNKQRGVVIVVALFIVALAAAMSYIMMSRLERDTHRTSLILRDADTSALAQASTLWAIDQLRNDWEQKQQNKLVDAIPLKSPKREENGYEVVSTIYDMQARFNINNLSVKEGQENFKRLLKTLVPKLTNEQIQQITKATTVWIQPGAKDNEFSKYYAQLKTPYRPAGRPMLSPSELRLVKGVTPAIYQAMLPYITALPEPTKINVQTASAPVLMLLGPHVSLLAAKQMESLRHSAPFVTPQDFIKLDVVKNNNIGQDQFTVVSQYFLVETEVSIENQRLVLYTLLMRKIKQRKAELSILWQSKGVW